MEFSLLADAPVQIQKKLNTNMTGEVLMVNSSGVYLHFGKDIVLLCDLNWGVIPIGIAVQSFKCIVKQLQLVEGQKINTRENSLICPNGLITFRFKTLLPLSHSYTKPDLTYIRRAALQLAALRRTKGISMLVLPLVLGERTEEVIELNPYCSQAYPLFCRLINDILCGEECEIRSCVDKILGLGTGLTPSCDDVIAGMLFVFYQIPYARPQAIGMLKKAVMAMAESHTNLVSSTFLHAMLIGERFERMEKVWSGMCGCEPLHIELLTQTGSNSGTEMLLGMLLGLRLCGYDLNT